MKRAPKPAETSQGPLTYLKVMTDHSADPFWAANGSMISFADLTMPEWLAKTFRAWADRFETLDVEIAGDGGEHALSAFNDQGRFLAAELKQQRPDLMVIYFDCELAKNDPLDPSSRPFEYEITKEDARLLITQKNHPRADYYHAKCRMCHTSFLGPKREIHCLHCHDRYFERLVPKMVGVFRAATLGGVPGLNAELLPAWVASYDPAYLSGTTRVVAATLGEMDPQEVAEIDAIAQSQGVELVLSYPGGSVGRFKDELDAAVLGRGEEAREAVRSIARRFVGASAALSDRAIRPMATAPRDGTPVLLRYRFEMSAVRPDLEGFSGLVFVGVNRLEEGGLDEWGFAAPIGYGGIPNEWLQGWAHISEGISA